MRASGTTWVLSGLWHIYIGNRGMTSEARALPGQDLTVPLVSIRRSREATEECLGKGLECGFVKGVVKMS